MCSRVLFNNNNYLAISLSEHWGNVLLNRTCGSSLRQGEGYDLSGLPTRLHTYTRVTEKGLWHLSHTQGFLRTALQDRKQFKQTYPEDIWSHPHVQQIIYLHNSPKTESKWRAERERERDLLTAIGYSGLQLFNDKSADNQSFPENRPYSAHCFCGTAKFPFPILNP